MPHLHGSTEREVVVFARKLGYILTYTARNRLRFSHPVTKAVVTASRTFNRQGHIVTYRKLKQGVR